MLKRASSEGHKTTAHVIGIAASMASAIACACDKLEIDANAFLMVHNPWSVAMGNAGDLRKEADTLDKFRDALLSIYRTKFKMDDEAIKTILDGETWILGEQASLYNIEAEVIPTAEPLKIAASLKTPKFFDTLKNTPKALREMIMENKDTNEIKADATPVTETVEEEVKVVVAEAETVETETVEETVESTVEEETTTQVEEEPVVVEEPEMVTKADCDKRVSGMQSAMAKQMNDLKKDYEAKIEDFNKQLKVKDEELISVKAQITSLTADLESAKKVNEELLVKASALESTLADKTDALAKLNAEVNTPNETFNWKTLKGKEFFDYVKKHPELVK